MTETIGCTLRYLEVQPRSDQGPGRDRGDQRQGLGKVSDLLDLLTVREIPRKSKKRSEITLVRDLKKLTPSIANDKSDVKRKEVDPIWGLFPGGV